MSEENVQVVRTVFDQFALGRTKQMAWWRSGDRLLAFALYQSSVTRTTMYRCPRCNSTSLSQYECTECGWADEKPAP